MRYLHSLFIAAGLSITHLLYTTYIERPPEERGFFYDDFMTSFRPMVNLLYNGSFSQPLTSAERNNLPIPLRTILDSAQSQGECLPRQGSYPGIGTLLLPSIILTDWLDLTIPQFERVTRALYFIYLTLFLSIIIYIVFEVCSFFHIKVYWGLLPLLLLPPYLLSMLMGDIYYFPLGLSVLALIASVKKRSYFYLFVSIFFAVWAYFSKFRAAPFIFIPVIIWMLSFGFDRGKPILILIPTWLIPQGLWSWHVYKHTCRWVLTDPSNIYGVTLCSNETVEACWMPTQVYNYVRIKLGELEAMLGMPHSIQYHPKSLMLCISQEIQKDSPTAACLPEWVYSKVLTKDRWKKVLLDIKRHRFGDSLSKSEKVSIAKQVVRELDTIMAELRREYKWLPFYRGVMVLYDNIFHPPQKAEEGRGRVPRWIKQAYFYYVSVYATTGLILGFFSSLYLLIGIWRNRYRTTEKGILLTLMGAAWGMIVVPVLTGHSEWRYFYISIFFGYILAAIALSDVAKRNKRISPKDQPNPKEGFGDTQSDA
ncbi:MAG: hypothetical protein NZZ60_08265 [Bacteroidia bacterium]|nr:hypothetical protein [Bacteroidia bacterium]